MDTFCLTNVALSNMETLILDSQQIQQKIERIAFQVYENTYNESQLFIAGIKGNGLEFAKRLTEQVRRISSSDYSKGVNLIEIEMDKNNPSADQILLSVNASDLDQVTVILTDDVINSGRTMMYGAGELLKQPIKELKTATLVNRTHRRFPILADFVGLDITTTLQDKIVVEFGEKERAYLV